MEGRRAHHGNKARPAALAAVLLGIASFLLPPAPGFALDLSIDICGRRS